MFHGSKAFGFVLFIGNLSFYLAFAFATISWGGWDTLGQLAQASWVRAREHRSLPSIPPSHPICSRPGDSQPAFISSCSLIHTPPLRVCPKAGKSSSAHPPALGESFPKVWGLQTSFPLHGHCLSLSLLQIQVWSPQPCAIDRFPGSRQKGQGDSRGSSWLPASTAERGSQEARFIPKNKASGDFPRCSWYHFIPFFLLLAPHPYFSNSLLEQRCYLSQSVNVLLPFLARSVYTPVVFFFFCPWIYTSLTFSYLCWLGRRTWIYLWGC